MNDFHLKFSDFLLSFGHTDDYWNLKYDFRSRITRVINHVNIRTIILSGFTDILE